MYIGEIIKSYREQHNMTVEEFVNKSNLSQAEITQLEELFQSDGTTPYPVAMRQIKSIAEAIEQPIPIIMNLISADQEIVVNVVAESDQPHAK
ncbi:MAG: helix-turn-helix transcriptional regulator [Veillonella parvula]|uniref:helix-turn-helix domain-containing protein n=1 Tax=Veillonella parvula TaxID=29466 RepID=UPI00241E51BC|nr:helix-turn-helix transcriptional regulator [Veillonella parvula]MBS5752099.1 helix-turn-helix transcriptional regulator [Veillonella parvula]MDU6126431.1 helix-turn-helix transcriptional regulator [Veillonella sp.]